MVLIKIWPDVFWLEGQSIANEVHEAVLIELSNHFKFFKCKEELWDDSDLVFALLWIDPEWILTWGSIFADKVQEVVLMKHFNHYKFFKCKEVDSEVTQT